MQIKFVQSRMHISNGFGEGTAAADHHMLKSHDNIGIGHFIIWSGVCARCPQITLKGRGIDEMMHDDRGRGSSKMAGNERVICEQSLISMGCSGDHIKSIFTLKSPMIKPKLLWKENTPNVPLFKIDWLCIIFGEFSTFTLRRDTVLALSFFH